MKEIEKIKPFKYLCMTVGNLPTSYLESMTYYETLCWLCKYLENTIIPTVNNNGEAVEELQNKYLELVDYVNHYFESLDYQTEVDKKLDEMADDGTLAEIINVEMIGSLQDLTTTDKTDIVSAINEVNASIGDVPAIGDLDDLTTTAKTDLVSAINEVNGKANTNTTNITTNTNAIGDLTDLTTTATTDLVSAVNEVNTTATNASDDIGDLTDLTTTATTDLVSAVNEVNAFVNNFTTVTGSVTISEADQGVASITINYPEGYTQSNTYVLNCYKTIPNKTYNFIGCTGGSYDYSQKNPGETIILRDDNINVRLVCMPPEAGTPAYYLATGTYTVTLLLMKM